MKRTSGPMPDEALMEAAASAWRERTPTGLREAPAWHDLEEMGRLEAYERAVVHRALEAAADPEGMSGTVHAVLARIKGT